MDATTELLIATLSELEDRYAELLMQDAAEKELASLWARIRELRQKLKAVATVTA